MNAQKKDGRARQQIQSIVNKKRYIETTVHVKKLYFKQQKHLPMCFFYCDYGIIVF
jgi:hypothetical protein